MPISWNHYVALRKITTEKFLIDNRISSYEELKGCVNTKDVDLPQPSEVEGLFWKPLKPVKESKVSTKDTSSQKTDISKRKPRRSRKPSTKKTTANK